ncbi:MAG: protease inhibitor I42 family protein [Coriobacteriia bacterium]|nr:protease inhibitor I42 family protein [Coriobacteriia bacterium]
MKRRYAALLAIALATVLVLSGCDDDVKLDEGADGSTVALRAGDVLELTLGSNRTTGYAWEAVQVPDCLEQSGEPEYESKGMPGMMGAPGEETWRFTASEAGEGTLLLEYRRSWETEQDPAQTFEVEVNVE